MLTDKIEVRCERSGEEDSYEQKEIMRDEVQDLEVFVHSLVIQSRLVRYDCEAKHANPAYGDNCSAGICLCVLLSAQNG